MRPTTTDEPSLKVSLGSYFKEASMSGLIDALVYVVVYGGIGLVVIKVVSNFRKGKSEGSEDAS